MKANAVESAARMLERAKAATRRLNDSLSTEEARDAWHDLLLATASVYSKLQTGAIGNGRSRGWIGRKLKERKDHEVLNYLHHARNSADHGIVEVTEPTPGFVTVGPAQGQTEMSLSLVTDENGIPTITPYSALNVRVGSGHIQLAEVRDDRFGDVFPPPMFGVTRSFVMKPSAAAQCAIFALEGLIEEAKTYVV